MSTIIQKSITALLAGIILITPSFAMSMAEVTNPTFYAFQLRYDGEDISKLDNNSPVPYFFYYGPLELSGSMTGRVLGLTGEIIGEFPYELEVGDNEIFIPYYADAGRIELLDKQSQSIYVYDISNISTCNKNKVCDSLDGESNTTCPSDCKAIEPESQLWPLVVALMVVTLVFSGLIFYLWRKSKINS